MSLTTPLVRPAQSQVTIQPTPKNPAADGFTYPNFRLLNKQARSSLSQPYEISASTHYHLLAIANSRGWFAGARYNGSSYEIALSPLDDLRSSSKAATEGSDNNFVFKRTISLPQGKPNIITFANQDSRLIVGLEQGLVLVYNAESLFAPGQDQVQPTHTRQLQSSALKQIAPNPGTEPNLVDRVAVVGNDFVQIFNMQLEPQGGWSASDPSTVPAAVAWSPKGKHIAIGLKTGDILTFALTNMSSPHKHIPPTFEGSLVSLSWTGPGHTFRTSYASEQDPTNPALHIVSLDTKSNTGTYHSLNHPYFAGDRSFQSPYLLQLPKWDEDASSNDHSNALFVFGDASSVDLEVLAHDSSTWYQQSQDNPVSLPLNKDMDDTALLSLDLDLTDNATSTPIVYAFLNDGTLQGWYLEHAKPYPLMITPSAAATLRAPDAIQPDASMSSEDQSTKLGPPFAQQAPSSAFGQSSFGTTSAFGTPSAFGQSTSTTSAFAKPAPTSTGFSAFASTSPSAFGAASQPSTTNTTSPFGGASNTTTTSTPFGSFGGAPSTFGSVGSSAFGSQSTGTFGGFGNQSGGSSVFGQTSFGSTPATSAFGSTATLAPPADMTREASMADDTTGFGGLSLGSSNTDASQSKPSGGIFGSFGAPASNPPSGGATSTTGGSSVLKPATGFGAFGAASSSPFSKPSEPTTTSSVSAFGQTSQPAPALAPASTNTTSAFGKPSFGQSSFGQTSLGKPAFGQPAFGQSSFGSTPSATTPSTGGFGAFASKPATFSGAAQSPAAPVSAFGATSTTGGGFGAFSSNNTGGFASALKSASGDAPAASSQPQAPATTSTSPFGSATSAFGKPSTTPVFGSSTTPSVFGGPAFGAKPSASQTSTAETPKKPAGISSPPSSPSAGNDSPSPVSAFTSTKPPVTTGAFANLQSSPSAFRPASGFGAFAATTSPETSPFYKKPEQQKAPASVFAALSSSGSGSPSAAAKPSGAPAFGSPSVLGGFAKPSSSPAFGSPSVFGGAKPGFPPPTPPSPSASKTTTTAGGFGAFSGTSTAFSAFSGSGSSFTDLLKSGDPSKGPSKTPAKEAESKDGKGAAAEKVEKPVVPPLDSVEAPDEPSKNSVSPESVKADTSFGDISSTGGSFVEVKSEEAKPSESKVEGEGEEKGEGDGEEGEVSDTRSIRSEDLEESDQDDEDYVPSPSDEEEEEEDDLSDDHLSDEDDLPREENEEDEGSQPPSPEPAAIPLPRSASATPVPDIKVTLSAERSGSTTPPGTPDKEPANVPPRKSPSPSPTSSSPSPPAFGGVGLGRPSTRPARSSPLASTPFSGDDEDEASKVPPAAPKPAPATLPGKAAASGNVQQSSAPVFSAPVPVKAPQMPGTPFLAHAQPPGRPASSGTDKPPAPPSLFGAPAGQGLFGQPPKPASTPPSITPPTNLFGGATAGLPKFDLSRPSSQPAAPTSLFGAPATAPPTATDKAPAPFTLPAFNLNLPAAPAAKAPSGMFGSAAGPAKPPVFGAAPSAPSGVFGSTPGPAKPPVFGAAPTAPSPFGAQPPAKPVFGGGQGFKIAPQAPPTGSFGGGPAAQPQPAFGVGPKPAAPAQKPTPAKPAPPPELTMEEGMQKECALLIMSLNKELEELRSHAQLASQKLQHLRKSAGGSWNRADLGDSGKWSLGDLKQFGQVTLKFVDELTVLEEQRDRIKQDIRDLNSSLLKAGTRREEIARFNKAKTDPEFAKMLKTRSLGPEHSETQTQLRRGIRAIRDRIQKLEGKLQESKKKLNESSTGKPSIKPPSLDTVNRSFRNIEIALGQKGDDIAALAVRFSKVDISRATPSLSTPVRDPRLPDRILRPVNVTPNVAATTAAALNAERGAHRLKKALLAARKEPLLNNSVNVSKPPPLGFDSPLRTPPKPELAKTATSGTAPAFSLPSSFSGGSFDTPVKNESQNAFALPDDDFSPSALLPGGSNSRRVVTKKHSSVQLPKRSPGTPTPAAPSFDWGPMPTFHKPPSTSLFASFKKEA
ncbi:hypothetical protein EST38_g4114 [Candolleomyces aberdarensis]|uniref:Nucleoporin Nup159/Nup146 N-terminal domain-containing protein n=1 Tax=Candolleomyces aberdarensis TaxID=2316362 RepID=A0A4Q2DNT9_9AGAR|nr:hypothetical protein EST38_g4114 [Candolleomyces aberdarensis]